MILCTGSQGEPMSALTRMAYHDHSHVAIEDGDTVIISAKPVPGNELRVHDTINRLAKSGAEVLHQEIARARLRARERGGDPPSWPCSGRTTSCPCTVSSACLRRLPGSRDLGVPADRIVPARTAPWWSCGAASPGSRPARGGQHVRRRSRRR